MLQDLQPEFFMMRGTWSDIPVDSSIGMCRIILGPGGDDADDACYKNLVMSLAMADIRHFLVGSPG